MPSETEAPLPSMSLGIVADVAAGSAYLCAYHAEKRTCATLTIPATGLPIRQEALDKSRCDTIDESTMKGVGRFLDDVAPPSTAATVLVEGDRIFPHPDYENTPAAVFEWNSAALGVLIALSKLDVPVIFGCYEVADREAMVVHHVASSEGFPKSERPKLLSRGLLRACTRLLLGFEPNDRQAAGVAALLSRAPGAYYYWSSFGEPPSLGDVVDQRRRGQTRVLVGTPTETFSMYIGKKGASVDDIALAYALAAQAHDGLGSNDLAKASLLTICKEFNFAMRCTSTRRDAVHVDPRRAWPWPENDAWAIEAIKAL